jgi:mRNA-degrading endonuclease RelE of RelBE toxin-antitoxin system
MVFVETSLFSKLLGDYLRDDEYRLLQNHLIEFPDAGDVIRGSGGVRKVRWASGGKGKSGGVRVIYYWAKADEQTFFLTLYGKGEKENLSAADLKRVVKLLEELTNE